MQLTVDGKSKHAVLNDTLNTDWCIHGEPIFLEIFWT